MQIKGVLYEVGGELKIANLSSQKMQIFCSQGSEPLTQFCGSDDEKKIISSLVEHQVTTVADVLLLGEAGLLALPGFGHKSFNLLREMLGFAP